MDAETRRRLEVLLEDLRCDAADSLREGHDADADRFTQQADALLAALPAEPPPAAPLAATQNSQGEEVIGPVIGRSPVQDITALLAALPAEPPESHPVTPRR